MRPNGAICVTTVLLLLLAIQCQRTELFGFILMTERWLNEHNWLLLAAALLRKQNRQRRQLRRAPYAWRLPRVNGSWFEIHYNDRAIPETFFWQQLRMNRATFDTVLNILGPRIVRENSRFRACLCPAKILAIGLYRLSFFVRGLNRAKMEVLGSDPEGRTYLAFDRRTGRKNLACPCFE